MNADHDAGELFITERDEDAHADGWFDFPHLIGEDAVEWNRQGDIAESGHEFFFGEYQKVF